jgi:hypothetical protein
MRWLVPFLLLVLAACGPLQPATAPPSYGNSRGSNSGS